MLIIIIFHFLAMAVNIVILDDIQDEVEFFSQLLAEAGYQPIGTDNEFELLEIIDTQTPGLILINTLIKELDSYSLCQKIKLLEKGKDIPILFLNRYRRYFEPEKIFNSGGADYINYPFSEVEVLAKVKTHLKIKDLEAQLQEKNRQLQKIIPHYQKLQISLEKAQAQVGKFSSLDPLTKLINRPRFEEVLHREWLRSSRERISFSDLYGTNISLILCQINDFAQYQENYEQELAENCLNMVAETIRKSARRPADLVAFYEGEKFAILLPNTDGEGAEKVAQLITDDIKQLQIPHPYSKISEYITVSMGVATGTPTSALPARELIEVAERALEKAVTQEREGIVIDNF
jgi:diguanylate cyclase (GGDEF)-like protein